MSLIFTQGKKSQTNSEEQREAEEVARLRLTYMEGMAEKTDFNNSSLIEIIWNTEVI